MYGLMGQEGSLPACVLDCQGSRLGPALSFGLWGGMAPGLQSRGHAGTKGGLSASSRPPGLRIARMSLGGSVLGLRPHEV